MIPGWRTKIIYATQYSQKKKTKTRIGRFHIKIEISGTSLVGPAVRNLLASEEDTGLIPGWGRSHMPQNN